MFYIYIMTNSQNTVLYIGITNNLERRVVEHRNSLTPGFTKKYNLKKLIYFEDCSNSIDAIRREKQLKNLHRDWKLNLIKKTNPDFNDLYQESLKDPETGSGGH